MLTWLNCSNVNLSRSVVLTLPRIVLRIDLRFLSSPASPVKITPTVARSLYQPITSVSLVDDTSARHDTAEGFSVLFRTLMIASIQQHKQKGYPGTLCPFALNGDHPLKCIFVQDLAFSRHYRLEARVYGFESLPERRAVTISSPIPHPSYARQEQTNDLNFSLMTGYSGVALRRWRVERYSA